MRARSSVLHPRAGAVVIPSHGCFILCPTSSFPCQRPGTLAVPVSGQGHSLPVCTGAGKCLWHVLGKVGVCFSHRLPRTCCGAASPWTSLLPLAHVDPELTLLPKSLEISAFFMAAMRPSIISEGATMWQPAGKEQRRREVPEAVTLPQEEVTPGPEGPRVPAALPGPARGGQGEPPPARSKSSPSWSQAQFAFGPAESERGPVCESQTWAPLPGDSSPALA